MFLCGKVVKQDIILHANTHLLTHIIYRRLHIHPIHLNGAAGGWKQPCQKGPETREYIVVKSFMLIKTNRFFFFLKMQYVVSHLHSGGFSSSIVTQQRGDMSLIERKVQIVYSVPVAVGLCQAIQRYSNRQSWDVFFSITCHATFTCRDMDKEKHRC